jgi:hypothetical protein
MFGNTAAVAESIGNGLAPSMEIELLEVANAPTALPGDVDLLVVGAPTHAFSLSRPPTRAEGHKQGGAKAGMPPESVNGSVPCGLNGCRVSRRSTRGVGKVCNLPGSAARKAARLGHERGLGKPVDQKSFWILDTPGPLAEGELDGARQWGTELADTVVAASGREAAGW